MDIFLKAMNDAGINPPVNVHCDGRLHRFYVEGDKKGSKNGWYVIHTDPLAGVFGCWKRGITRNWFGTDYKTLTDEEKARFSANQKNQKKQRRIEEERVRAECQQRASRIWDSSSEAPDSHPYLVKKKVAPFGLRIWKGCLVAPVHKINQQLVGLLFIDADGRKNFLTGTDKKGGHFIIGNNPHDILYLAEGYATAATVHKATSQPVAVCFDCGNLKHVAQSLRAKFPDIQIVVCADNDHHSDNNPGLSKATKAAAEVDGLLAVPAFPAGAAGSDFNDLAAAVGIDEVRQQILAARTLERPCPETTISTITWDDPLLFGVINTPRIPSSILPSWLGEFALALTRSLQTPEGIVVMMLLSCTATCLQKKFVVEVDSGYREPLNLWTVTAIDPGSRKTAVVTAVTEPLNAWEKEQSELLTPEIRRITIERMVGAKRIKKLTSQAADEDDPIEREAITRELIRLEGEMPEELFSPQLWTGDVTPERLQNLLVEQREKMALLSDEAVIFNIMTGLYSDSGAVNLDIFLQAHAGSAGRTDRTARVAHLTAPALTFGLSIQPAVLSDLGTVGLKRLRGRGALDRFLYCIPENTVGKRDVRNKPTVPESVRLQYHTGIFRLLNINPVFDDSGKEQPRRLTLDPLAYECWLAFSEYIETLLAEPGNPICGWLSKIPGAALRIAGNFHLVEHDDLSSTIINDQTMERALDLATLLMKHAVAAFDLMTTEEVISDAREIVSWVTGSSLDVFTKNEVRRAFKGRWTKPERLNRALNELQKRDIIGGAFKKKTQGRHATAYPVNPKIVKKVAA